MPPTYGASAGKGNRSALSRAADLIWPPRSLLTDRSVDRPGVIEPQAWNELRFLTDPLCFRCGFPLPEHVSDEAVCAACAADPPVFDRARAALIYDDVSRKLVLDLKRGGRRDGLPVFAAWMRHAAAPLLDDIEMIAPAPMHWLRLAERGFNQAAWLAQHLARMAGKSWSPTVLERWKRRRSQEGLSAAQRRRNVAGAIRVAGRWKNSLEGRGVLVVDDVYTTGATLEACARALRRAGAKPVHVVTLGRVVRPVDIPI